MNADRTASIHSWSIFDSCGR